MEMLGKYFGIRKNIYTRKILKEISTTLQY